MGSVTVVACLAVLLGCGEGSGAGDDGSDPIPDGGAEQDAAAPLECEEQELASWTAAAAASLAVDDVSVYWTQGDRDTGDTSYPNTGSVGIVPIGGGAVGSLASSQSGTRTIVAAGPEVYWLTSGYSGNGVVHRHTLAGGETLSLGVSPDPVGLALDDTHAWWTDGVDFALMRVPRSGAERESVVAPIEGVPAGVATGVDDVYWSTGEGVFVLAHSGGEPTQVSDRGTSRPSFALDDTHAWLIAGEDLVRVPLDGGAAETILSGSGAYDGPVYSFVLAPDRIWVARAVDVVAVERETWRTDLVMSNPDGVQVTAIAANATDLFLATFDGGPREARIVRLTCR